MFIWEKSRADPSASWEDRWLWLLVSSSLEGAGVEAGGWGCHSGAS